MSITRALSESANFSRIYGRPLPVIFTDWRTAHYLSDAIAAELGCSVSLIATGMPPGVISMFDGVQIKAEMK